MNDLNFSGPYQSPDGPISWLTKVCTGGRCCFPGCNNSAEKIHYAENQDELTEEVTKFYGRELIGLHCFPLCTKHHEEIKNTESDKELLKAGFREKLLPDYKDYRWADWIQHKDPGLPGFIVKKTVEHSGFVIIKISLRGSGFIITSPLGHTRFIMKGDFRYEFILIFTL